MIEKIDVLKAFLGLLENFSLDESRYRQLLAPDVKFVVFPNLLAKVTHTRDFAESMKGIAQGRALLRSQSYHISSHFESGARLAVELVWTGTMAVDAGPLKKGQTLSAHVCMIAEFAGGKIVAQRNYDCYEAF